MKILLFMSLLGWYSTVEAQIYRCVDEKGNIAFSDAVECSNPEKVEVIKGKSSGERASTKITIQNADELRNSPNAVKLSFSREEKYAVFGYYEGFYIVNSDHVSIFIDRARITKTGYGNRGEVNLERIQFVLVTLGKFGSEKDNWIYSDEYRINRKLADRESVIYENIEFEISTVGYGTDELRKYKIAADVGFDQKYSVPIISDEFLKID